MSIQKGIYIYINSDICLFWCPYETYHRLCVILFWAWNACDVSDPGRFLWDFNYDRLYPAWILSFLWLLVHRIINSSGVNVSETYYSVY